VAALHIDAPISEPGEHNLDGRDSDLCAGSRIDAEAWNDPDWGMPVWLAVTTGFAARCIHRAGTGATGDCWL
jgi:hypothetical protein